VSQKLSGRKVFNRKAFSMIETLVGFLLFAFLVGGAFTKIFAKRLGLRSLLPEFF